MEKNLDITNQFSQSRGTLLDRGSTVLFEGFLRSEALNLLTKYGIVCHQALDKMESEWKPVMLEVMPYKETGTFIMKVSDDCSQLLDDHIVMAQSMSFSPYKKPFEERITTWESKLVMTQDVMDEWLQCQRQWLYLEPIFSSEDINRQLPVESKRYQTMERIWRKVMNSAKGNPQVQRKNLIFNSLKGGRFI